MWDRSISSKMKKILFIGRFPPPVHGASKMNQIYFNILNKDKNFKLKKIKINKYESIEEIGKFNKRKMLGYLSTVKELISNSIKFNQDITYIEMAPRGIAFLKDSIFVFISKIFSKKVFIQFHAKGARQTTKSKIAETYYRFILRKTKVILLSKILYKDIENVLNKEQLKILPNRIPNELTEKKFRNIIEKRSKKTSKEFLFLSNMIESKGSLEVLKICSYLKKRGLKFNCNFVGKFQEEKFKNIFNNKIKELKLSKFCKYLGPKYNEEKNKIIQNTDLLIFPTRYPEECYPLVILEAFMHGIPVFSYDNGAISDMINKKFLGHVSSSNNWKELAKKIENKKYSKNISEKIRKEFKKKHILNDKIKTILK